MNRVININYDDIYFRVIQATYNKIIAIANWTEYDSNQSVSINHNYTLIGTPNVYNSDTGNYEDDWRLYRYQHKDIPETYFSDGGKVLRANGGSSSGSWSLVEFPVIINLQDSNGAIVENPYDSYGMYRAHTWYSIADAC